MKYPMAVIAACALAACAAPGPGGGPRDLRPVANPSDVVAAELAFARAAQDKGQWTAFADYAADVAVMFVPEPVTARDWLKGRANPPQAVTWQPAQVWSSCDGSLAATRGGWQRPDGSVGYFTTVWQRQRDNSYKWVMDQGDTLAQPLAVPEMIGAAIANCSAPPAVPPADASAAPRTFGGTSKDRTMQWSVAVDENNARTVSVRYWDGTAWRDAVHAEVAGG